jgi:hypothetical protein
MNEADGLSGSSAKHRREPARRLRGVSRVVFHNLGARKLSLDGVLGAASGETRSSDRIAVQ